MLDFLQPGQGIALPEPGVQDHAIHGSEDEGSGCCRVQAGAKLASVTPLYALDQ